MLLASNVKNERKNSALLGLKKGSPSIIQKIRERSLSFFVSFLLDIGTFVERLWNVCSFTVLTLLLLASLFTESCGIYLIELYGFDSAHLPWKETSIL